MKHPMKHSMLHLPLLALFALPGCAWITQDELATRADRDGDGVEAAQFGGGDCDDQDKAVFPGAEERCNDADDDCDGEIDDVALGPDTTWYADADEDGAGDPDAPIASCEAPEGAVDNALDCDDTNAGVSPSAAERCDEVDEDCDGQVDEDALDAPLWYTDADGDGYGVEEGALSACSAPDGRVASAGDCDDQDAAAHPYAEEACSDEDTNCDGVPGAQDGDEDGVRGCDGDCDDQDALVYPGAEEVCDEIDDDCDSLVDDEDPSLNTEGLTRYYPDADGDGFGDAADAGTPACEAPEGAVADASDCDDGSAEISPADYEVCSTAADDDCDGATDDCSLALDTLELSFHGEDEGERAGLALAGGQDLDGDGGADLAVGAPDKDGGRGGVYVVIGPMTASSALGDAPAWKGTDSADEAGASLAALADQDGDGLGELLVGAPGGDQAYLLAGPATAGGGLSGAEVILDGVAGSRFGGTLAVGDLDGDEVEDLVLGAPDELVDGLLSDLEGVGSVYTFLGPRGVDADIDDADARFHRSTDEAESYTGRALATCDPDGDGQDDVVISVIDYNTLRTSATPLVHLVEMVDGELSESEATLTLTGSSGETSGGALASQGDVNGDGKDDLLVADVDAARAWLFLGPSSSESLSGADARLEGEGDFGLSVALIPDLEGDGDDELLVGGANAAALWYGGALTGTLDEPDLTLGGDGSADESGAALSAGDADDDGLPDLYIGAPGARSDLGLVYLVPGSPL